MKKQLIGLGVAVLMFGGVGSADATILVDIQEVGTDVVVSYSGMLDLDSTAGKEADLNYSSNVLFSVPGGSIQTYNANGAVDDYNLVANSIVRPDVTDIFGNSLSGGNITGAPLLIDIWAYGGQIFLSDGYVSNTFFSGSNIFSNKSFIELNPTIGTFEWTWGNGGGTDNLILTVGPSPVPEPTTMLHFGTGIVGIAAVGRKRRK